MLRIHDVSIRKLKSDELIKELPELYELKEVVENNSSHDHENVFDHTLDVLKKMNVITRQLKPEIKSYMNEEISDYKRKDLVFLATLFHDIAKKETISYNEEKTSCLGHEQAGSQKASKLLNRFDISPQEKIIVLYLIKNHGEIHSLLDDKENLEKNFDAYKRKHEKLFLEQIVMGFADTFGSHLKYSKPESFRFRIDFYKKILY
jgi:putative nucleotidyltransferase with HDIG domain